MDAGCHDDRQAALSAAGGGAGSGGGYLKHGRVNGGQRVRFVRRGEILFFEGRISKSCTVPYI